MAVTNSEQLITILGRITQTTDRASGMNAFLEWMHYKGHDDVADAFITWLNATNTVLTSTLNPTIVSQPKARVYTAHTSHERA